MRIIAIILIFYFTTAILYADTVILKDRNRVKGLVVDEYTDRITLSTVDGEKAVFRKDIERIEYDAPEQNFMQLGRAYESKGWYEKAAFYYKKAMDVNPDYQEARDAYIATYTRIWRQEEKMTRKELERHNMVMDWWKERYQKGSPSSNDRVSLLKRILGISLIEKDGIFIIDSVVPDSGADKAGIAEGDVLSGIWGKLIRYSKMEDVVDDLLGPKYSEVKVSITKEIAIPIGKNTKDLYKELGILLGFEYEGLVVKETGDGKKGEFGGIKKGDFVIAIDNNITRYLSLDSVISLINSSSNSENIVFTVRRSVNLRREGE